MRGSEGFVEIERETSCIRAMCSISEDCAERCRIGRYLPDVQTDNMYEEKRRECIPYILAS